MIKDLSQEFGVPISQEELIDGQVLPVSPQLDDNEEDVQHQTSNLPLEIQVHQDKYLQWRNNMLLKNQVHRDSVVQVGVLSLPPCWAVVQEARLNYARSFASSPTYLSRPWI